MFQYIAICVFLFLADLLIFYGVLSRFVFHVVFFCMVGWLSTESGGILEMQYVDDGLVHAVRDCVLCSAVFTRNTSLVCKQQYSVSTSMHDASQIDAWSLCNNTQEELHAAFTASDININYSLCHKRSYKKHSILIVVVFVYNGAVSVAFFFGCEKTFGMDMQLVMFGALIIEVWYCHCCCCFCVCFCWFFCCCCYLAHEVLVLLLFRAWSVGSLQVIMRPDAT